MLLNCYIKVSYIVNIIGFTATVHIEIYKQQHVSSFGMSSLKGFNLFLFLINMIRNLQQVRITLRGFLNLVLVCNDNDAR